MEEVTTKSKNSVGMVIGIAVLVAIVFGGGAYAYMNNKATKEKNDLNAQITELQKQVATLGTITTTTPVSSTSVTTDETANWTTYTNTQYGFSYKYPATGYTAIAQLTQGDPKDIIFYFGLKEDKYKGEAEYSGLFNGNVFVNNTGLSLDKFITEGNIEGINYQSGIKAQKVGNKDGYYFISSGYIGYDTYAVQLSGNKILIISTTQSSSNFLKILNTLNIN